MTVWIGLALSLVSAVAVNWAYTFEHAAANELPPLSARRPLESARSLVGSRAWLAGFGLETGGWLVYLAALRLAPLALVQTVGAAGIAVLALVQSRGDIRRLSQRERLATASVVGGLVLLGLSLVGQSPTTTQPHWAAALVWLGACAGGAALVTLVRTRLTAAVALGLGAGLLFAIGDISAKLVVYGGGWLLLVFLLVAGYALGSIELQSAFQHGDALTAAGMATLTTNAVPIAAGVVLLREEIPGGAQGGMQIAAFATLVLGATLLNDRRVRRER
jgi:NADH:ubiquinone oxidoreductase subunit 6 (subunit J)